VILLVGILAFAMGVCVGRGYEIRGEIRWLRWYLRHGREDG